MNLFIAVAFFCMGGECAFWKADEVFQTHLQCEVAAQLFMLEAQKEGAERLYATCMPIEIGPKT